MMWMYYKFTSLVGLKKCLLQVRQM